MNAHAKKNAVGFTAVAAATAFMLALTWRTWPDAIYDFGSQLYYPWRLAAGQHLYTDIAYFNGPLSQWINATAFELFGVGLTTLVAVNLAIVVAVAAVLWRLTSVAGVLVFILVFAFGQYVTIGNYNWLCPYTHEVTHGVALSVAAILVSRRITAWRAAITGVLLGLVFLTKAEVFAPAVTAIATGMAVNRAGRRWAGIAVATALIPPLVAFAILTSQSGSSVGLRGVLGSWPWIFDRRVSGLAFYRQGLGVDDVSGNAIRLLTAAAVELPAIGLIVFAGIGPGRWRTAAVVVAGMAAAAALFFWTGMQDVARPWPLIVAAVAAVRFFQTTPVSEARPRPGSGLPGSGSWACPGTRRPPEATGRLVLAIFALGLLGKMLLNARIAQYGFALAMPAGVILADAAVATLPQWIAARGGDPRRSRLAAAVLVTATVAVHVCMTGLLASRDTVSVGTGPDQFFADHRGVEVNAAIRQLADIDPHGSTLAVFPQGLMLNYLARRPDPVAVVNLMPPEVISTGEPNVIAMLNASPPDAVVISEKDVDDGGFLLTEGHYLYAKPVYAWVMRHYRRRTQADPRSNLKLSVWTRR
jgi:hypothetical protein